MLDFRLYVILDLDACRSKNNVIQVAQRALAGGAEVLQIRAKNYPDVKLKQLAEQISSLTGKAKARLLINDRVDLAQNVDADGVHLGQQDQTIDQARSILGPGKIIGCSTHSLKQAEQAQAQGADYIAIGPIFATGTKPELKPIGLKILTQAKNKIKIPFLAIGGINLNNLQQVLNAGAKRVAVCRTIVTAKDITAKTKEFKRRLYNPQP